MNEKYCVSYKYKNGFITIVINSNVELIDDTLLGTIPNQYCPSEDFYSSNYTNNNAALYIRTNGEVRWNKTSYYNHCSITYPV